ncbi:MAG: hypothetical protein ACTHU0_07420 [Kofleriaceae bacterium]
MPPRILEPRRYAIVIETRDLPGEERAMMKQISTVALISIVLALAGTASSSNGCAKRGDPPQQTRGGGEPPEGATSHGSPETRTSHRRSKGPSSRPGDPSP